MKIVKTCKEVYYIDDNIVDAIIMNTPLDELMMLLPGGNNMFMTGLYFRFDINLGSKTGETYCASIWDWQGDRSTTDYKKCYANIPGLAIRNLIRWFVMEHIPGLEISNYIKDSVDKKKWDDLKYIRNTLESFKHYV